MRVFGETRVVTVCLLSYSYTGSHSGGVYLRHTGRVVGVVGQVGVRPEVSLVYYVQLTQ